MADLHVHPDRLEIHLTRAEKVLALKRDDLVIPRDSIRPYDILERCRRHRISGVVMASTVFSAPAPDMREASSSSGGSCSNVLWLFLTPKVTNLVR